MITKASIQTIIEQELAEKQEFYIVDIVVSDGDNILVELDHKTRPITIDECKAFSRAIEQSLDRDTEDFKLEVSSPGLSNPFKVIEQYKKNVNKEVDIVLNNGKQLKGLLVDADEEKIKVVTAYKEKIEGKKKKQLITTEHLLNYNDIKKTQIIITFK